MTTIEGFRDGLRAWLDDHDLTPPADDSLAASVAQPPRVRHALYKADWMRYGWPGSVGGLGGPLVLRAVFGEEEVGRGLTDPDIHSLVEILGPTMIAWAPPQLTAQMVSRQWCQGFSEPAPAATSPR